MNIKKLNEKIEKILEQKDLFEYKEEILEHDVWEKKLYELEEPGLDYKVGEDGEKIYFQESVINEYTDEEFDKAYKVILLEEITKMKEEIHTLKNCNIFFTVLAVISIICAFIMVISTASALSSPYGF